MPGAPDGRERDIDRDRLTRVRHDRRERRRRVDRHLPEVARVRRHRQVERLRLHGHRAGRAAGRRRSRVRPALGRLGVPDAGRRPSPQPACRNPRRCLHTASRLPGEALARTGSPMSSSKSNIAGTVEVCATRETRRLGRHDPHRLRGCVRHRQRDRAGSPELRCQRQCLGAVQARIDEEVLRRRAGVGDGHRDRHRGSGRQPRCRSRRARRGR